MAYSSQGKLIGELYVCSCLAGGSSKLQGYNCALYRLFIAGFLNQIPYFSIVCTVALMKLGGPHSHMSSWLVNIHTDHSIKEVITSVNYHMNRCVKDV